MNLYQKSKFCGVIGSVIFHALLLLILLCCSLSRIVPDTEEGLAVSLGVDENGGDGLFEPTPASEIEGSPAPEPPSQPPVSGEEELVTQDIEESYQAPEVKQKTKEQLEQERIRREEKKKREQELAEQRRAEAEAKAIKDAQDKKAKEIGNRTKNIFGGNGAGGSGNTESSSGKGNGKGSGSQGNPFGSQEATGAEGSAKSGNGNSWSLGGRSLVGSLSKPVYSAQEEGKVVVSIIVDKSGNVISAEVGRGTNTDNVALRNAAVSAAKKAKFNPIQTDKNQSGTITYNFSLQ
ncbi:MAG: TonB family protein [Prevotellaceae bacterium]|nr:TonB family protein [Prevotellaceae bacterium]